MAELTLRVLGTLELSDKDKPIIIRFRSDKIRALLIYLALEPGRPHQRRSLAALLWPDFSEQDSLRNLRKALFHLRETFDQVSPQTSQLLLTIDRQTVQLNAIHLTVDAVQFEQLLAEVEQHSHRQLHNCPQCLARLVEAESLFRGELLLGFGLADATVFEEWLLFKREQLQQKAILALQNLADIFERQSDYERAEKYAARLTLVDPYHEKAVRQLMRIMTKTNRRSTALQLHRSLADRLQSEIGVAPEERTSLLFRQIAEGNFVEPVRSMGKMHHFPTPFTPFLGRKEELAQVSNLLLDANCRLLTIIGPGGIGKTRLAVEAAKQAANSERFADGIYFAHLGDVESGDDLPMALATTLSLQPRAEAPLLGQLSASLQSQSCLLLLDNFEHLTGIEQLVAELLAAAPELTLLVTSRRPLNLRAEQQVRIGGLDYPKQTFEGGQTVDLSQVQTYDAIRLFVQSARLVQPDFAASATNLPAIIRICRLTQGIPLALEIAAAWVRLMDVAHIAEAIESSLDFLASPALDLPDRHRSMRAVFDYSWKLLTPAERLTLAKAAIFVEPFTMATAVAVLETTVSDVAVLLDKSLLQSPASGHYGLHELLRHYALGKLQEIDKGQSIEVNVRHRHSGHFLNLVEQMVPGFYGSEPQVAAATIRQCLGNVTQAWWWAVEHAAEPELMCLIARSADGLGRVFDFWGLTGEGERMIGGAVVKVEAVVKEAGVGGTAVSAFISHLLTWQAHFQNRLGEAEAAIQTAQKALAYGEQEPAPVVRAKSLLGELLPNVGQFDQAESYQQEALAYYQEVGDKTAQAQALGRLGTMRWRRGSYSEAIPVLEEALAMQETLGNKRALATLNSSIAGAFYEQGNMKLAQAHVEQARNIFTEIDSVIGVAQTDGYMALLFLKLGQYKLALAHNQQELDVYRSMGDRQGIATTIGNRGSILVEVGKFDEALVCYEEAIQLTGSLGLSWHQAMHQTSLASVWREKGEDDRAMALFEKATPLLREHGAKYYMVSPLLMEARILLGNGRLSEAQPLLDEALELAEQLNLKQYIFEARTLCARLNFVRGKAAQAQRTMLKMLVDSDDQAEQARLHYELWRMDAGDKHAQTAYELYYQLYEQLPNYKFKRRLNELQTVVE